MPTRCCYEFCRQHCLTQGRHQGEEAESEAREIKEFVIIGNGPSGISLSYMLSGNWPFYTGGSQDELLDARLRDQAHLSLVEQDLQFLSDGLEGRSNNPVSLLFDALQRPEADLGLDLPSLLEWHHLPQHKAEHVVLGRGRPGGVWQTLDGGLLTVSLGAWMQLPNLSMHQWMESQDKKEDVEDDSLVSKRSSISAVSQYYTDYTNQMGLAKNFRNFTVVTSVKQLGKDDPRRRGKSCVPGEETSHPAEQLPEQQLEQRQEQPEQLQQQQQLDDQENEWKEMFQLDDDDLSSNCSSLTHSASPVREETCYSRSNEDSMSFYGRRGGREETMSFNSRLCLCLRDGSLHTCDTDSGLSSSDCNSRGGPTSATSAEASCSASYTRTSAAASCSASYTVTSRLVNPSSGPAWVPSSYRGQDRPLAYSRPRNISTSNFDGEICPSWDPILNPSLFSYSHNFIDSRDSSPTLYGHTAATSLLSRSYSCPNQTESQDTLFEVSGYEILEPGAGTGKTAPFSYLTRNVVLATGLDEPNTLNVPGEGLPFVIHSLRELEMAVESGGLTPNSDPVMVIGAGLSAADAILNAQSHSIPVVHVFRREVDDPALIFNKLPVNLYPEYQTVHEMMAEGSVGGTKIVRGQAVEREHPGYRSYSQTNVREITKDRRVKLFGPNTNQDIQVSYVLILVGASPNLEFLEEETLLGRIPGQPIDKNNPIDIDVFSHQSVQVPGLFAMGPLTGDNFVRFLQGGALAITSFAQHQKQRNVHSSREQHKK